MKLSDLMSEYRDSLETPVVPEFDGLLRKHRRRASLLWMAAAAAVIAGIALWPRADMADVFLPPEPTVAKVNREPAVVAPVARPLVRSVATPRRVVRNEMTGFIAIAETSMLPQPQTFQVLRVNVSGNRLAALGVLRPNQEMRPSMMADVLMGDDGMARAIRVVAEE